MKICLVTHCFYPSKLRGGPTVSMNNMAKAIGKFDQVYVITVGTEKDGSKYTEVRPGHNPIFGCDVNYLTENTPIAFYRALQEVKPDVIYISSLFSWQYSLASLYYGKRFKTRTVLAPRGELMPAALAIKKWQKQLFLWVVKGICLPRNINIHVTAEDEYSQALKVFPKAKIWCVRNIPTIPDVKGVIATKQAGELRIAMVGRIHPIKNVTMALEMLQNIQGNILVDIYGSEEVVEYAKQCRAIAQTLPDHIHVFFHGVVDHDEISSVLTEHHILLSPTQSENFGQAIVESMLNGRPVIISNNTPWKGLEKRMCGYDIPLDHPQQYQSAIQRFVDMEQYEYAQWCEAAVKYIYEEMQIDEDIEKYKRMLFIKN